MANVTSFADYSVPPRGAGPIARLRAAVAEHRERRSVLRELNALSDRDLADIGISRLEIEEVARGAARRR